jgi:hypothetical protein
MLSMRCCRYTGLKSSGGGRNGGFFFGGWISIIIKKEREYIFHIKE